MGHEKWLLNQAKVIFSWSCSEYFCWRGTASTEGLNSSSGTGTFQQKHNWTCELCALVAVTFCTAPPHLRLLPTDIRLRPWYWQVDASQMIPIPPNPKLLGSIKFPGTASEDPVNSELWWRSLSGNWGFLFLRNHYHNSLTKTISLYKKKIIIKEPRVK